MSLAIELAGPCKGPVEIMAKGAIIKAPPELSKFTKDSWITIRNVDRLTMTGGTFDGQGQETWKSKKCKDSTSCQVPVVSVIFIKIPKINILLIIQINI